MRIVSLAMVIIAPPLSNRRLSRAPASWSPPRSTRNLANLESSGIFPAMTRRFTALALPVIAGGCYRYSAIAPAAAEQASEVRLNLSHAGSLALVPTLGVSTAAAEGRIVRVTDSAYVLAVSSTLKRTDENPESMTRTVWAGDSVSIPKSAVASVEQRSLDGRRTAVAASVATVLGVLAARLIVHSVGSSGSESGTGTPVVTP